MKDQLLSSGESLFSAVLEHFGGLERLPQNLLSPMNDWVNACIELDLDRQFLENGGKNDLH